LDLLTCTHIIPLPHPTPPLSLPPPQGQQVLPNGVAWQQHLLVLMVSAKLLADAESAMQTHGDSNAGSKHSRMGAGEQEGGRGGGSFAGGGGGGDGEEGEYALSAIQKGFAAARPCSLRVHSGNGH